MPTLLIVPKCDQRFQKISSIKQYKTRLLWVSFFTRADRIGHWNVRETLLRVQINGAIQVFLIYKKNRLYKKRSTRYFEIKKQIHILK